MLTAFLPWLDQLRYILGMLILLFLLCHRALPHREHYRLRAMGCTVAAVAAALAYLPLQRLAQTLTDSPLAIAPYWLIMSFMPVGIVLFCYETNLPGALFRTMMASFAENIVTVLIRYLFVMSFFPDFPEEHPLLYILLMAGVYTVFYVLYIRLLGRRIRTDESSLYQERTAGLAYLFIYLSYTAILSTTKVVCENIIPPLADSGAYQGIYRYLQYFLVADMLLISVVMTVILWHIYERISIQNEKQVILQMARARESQYEFSRENIEMINRKAHDLRHQLRALEQVSDEERRRQIRETRKAIDFYDAAVKTGNDALDTLLTEKSVYCANRGIRLSCTVRSEGLAEIGVVDLYTLLGNAIDNAIESVEHLEAEDQKTISLSIQDVAGMIYIQIENYYAGELQMVDGLPVTRKADKGNHGFGVKSIRAIAQRYGGKIRMSTHSQVFQLQIMIPMLECKGQQCKNG